MAKNNEESASRATPDHEEIALAEKFALGLEATPAAQPCGDLSDDDLADISYHQKKISGELRKRDDDLALDLQVQLQGWIGWLPA